MSKPLVICISRRTSWGRVATQIASSFGTDCWEAGFVPGGAEKIPAGAATVAIIVGDPCWAARSLRAGLRNLVVTAWETTALPPVAARRLGSADCVVVPSRFCEQVFAGAILPRVVTRIPMDVDPCFRVPAMPHAGLTGRRIRIGVGGATNGAGRRKRLYDLLSVFHHTPHLHETLELDVRVPHRPSWAEAREFRATTWLVGNELSVDAQVAWYDSLDGYMTVSAGEGFDLMTLEALARGLPVAGTDWGATAEHSLTVRLPYSLGLMAPICPFYPAPGAAAVVDLGAMVSGLGRLEQVIRRRQGLHVPQVGSPSAWLPRLQEVVAALQS